MTGLLLAGVGNVDTARKSNFLTVDSSACAFAAPRRTANRWHQKARTDSRVRTCFRRRNPAHVHDRDIRQPD